nr:SDR family oxidoreductase [Desulfohalovibrio reitneri]
MQDKAPVLLTGGTGYVGGRLAPMLLERGHRVRAVGRSADKLRCRAFASHPGCEVAEADLHDPESIKRALEGCSTAYYLVHSMHSRHHDFAYADRQAAYNFVEAANHTGLKRIIYLGGLGDDDENLSEHLRSRAETGRILQLANADVTILRAAMVMGSGSASFEMLRYLTENLPAMLAPRWVRTKNQPIAVSNVLEYLAGCLEHPETAGRTFDIGGPEVTTYADLVQTYAKEAGLRRRLIIPVPLLSPWLSSYWLGLVTPVPMALARPLVEGLRNEVICRENAIREIIPQRLLTPAETFYRALEKVSQEAVDTCWSDAGRTLPAEWTRCGDPSYAGGRELQCGYRCLLSGRPEDIWPTVAAIGGETGWYGADRLWRMRGVMDDLAGGPGLRRGRRHPREILEGDALDFFRVIKAEENERLLLLSEMKTPGEALLEIHLERFGTEKTELTLLARFLPRGVPGLLYWYSVYPLHHLVFSKMLRGMAAACGAEVLEGPSRYTPVWRNSCAMFLPGKGGSGDEAGKGAD